MTSSETTATLCAALVAAQQGLKPIAKDGKNPAFRSRYATLDGIMETVRPALAAHGLAVVQGVTHPETDGGRLVGIMVETRLVHTSGEWLASVVPVPVAKGDAHGLGSALSYGRRYGLSALLALSTDEDDDGNAAAKAPPAKPAPAKPAPPAPAPGQRLHDRVPETPPERMSLAKAETVELKGQRLVDMSPDRLDKLRTWAEEKGNSFILAAIDAIQAAREAADEPGGDGEVEPLDGSLPF